MTIQTVAILSPGDMGHAVGALLGQHGLRVVTCLEGRSARTRTLADKAGIADISAMGTLVEQADIVLSITVSDAVPALCQHVADAIRRTEAGVLFAECNAIAPQLARRMEAVISDSGGRFVDASIIGGPPRNGSSPRFYVSGPHAQEMEELRNYGLDIRQMGPDTGRASGIKMCYAAMTKGSAALFAELLLAAEAMSLSQELLAEFRSSQPAVYQRMKGGLPGLPANSRRWVSEMEEIEATFAELGLTPAIFRGVADMYRLIGDSPLGQETPETRDATRTLEQTVSQLAASLKQEPK